MRNTMSRSNMGFAESLVWEALRQLAVAWPRLKMATTAIFNRLLAQSEIVAAVVLVSDVAITTPAMIALVATAGSTH